MKIMKNITLNKTKHQMFLLHFCCVKIVGGGGGVHVVGVDIY